MPRELFGEGRFRCYHRFQPLAFLIRPIADLRPGDRQLMGDAAIVVDFDEHHPFAVADQFRRRRAARRLDTTFGVDVDADETVSVEQFLDLGQRGVTVGRLFL